MTFLPDAESSRPSSSEEAIITQVLQKQTCGELGSYSVVGKLFAPFALLHRSLVLLQVADYCLFLLELGE